MQFNSGTPAKATEGDIKPLPTSENDGGGAINEKLSPFVANKNEIFYNIVNSGLTGVLAGLVSIQAGVSLTPSLVVALVAGVTRFAYYWEKEQEEYCKQGLFCFI